MILVVQTKLRRRRLTEGSAALGGTPGRPGPPARLIGSDSAARLRPAAAAASEAQADTVTVRLQASDWQPGRPGGPGCPSQRTQCTVDQLITCTELGSEQSLFTACHVFQGSSSFWGLSVE
eukprot:753413-Hanusia_phi.AAC.1